MNDGIPKWAAAVNTFSQTHFRHFKLFMILTIILSKSSNPMTLVNLLSHLELSELFSSELSTANPK